MLRTGFVFDGPLRTPTYSTKQISKNTQAYRSGHNEAVLKTSFVCLCNFLKTLDFIGFFASSDALCEKRFSQFSRNFPWLGLRFLIKLNTRRVIEVVITRRSWKPFAFTGAWVRISHPPPLALEFGWIPRLFSLFTAYQFLICYAVNERAFSITDALPLLLCASRCA